MGDVTYDDDRCYECTGYGDVRRCNTTRPDPEETPDDMRKCNTIGPDPEEKADDVR